MGIIKSHSDKNALQQAGRITQNVLDTLGKMLSPGLSTVELEISANRILSQSRSTAPFKSYHGFNHAICVSLNDEIVNGPPSRERKIQAGDVVSIATAAEYRGIHAKAARTFYVNPDQNTSSWPEPVRRLIQGTDAVIQAAVQKRPHCQTLNQLLTVVPETAQTFGLTLIQNMGGAGIGKKLHENPPIPNDPEDLTETIPLQPGLCFTLMPMFCLGSDPAYRESEDGWTFITNDGSLSAHFADTLLITDDGVINVTRSSAENPSATLSSS